MVGTCLRTDRYGDERPITLIFVWPLSRETHDAENKDMAGCKTWPVGQGKTTPNLRVMLTHLTCYELSATIDNFVILVARPSSKHEAVDTTLTWRRQPPSDDIVLAKADGDASLKNTTVAEIPAVSAVRQKRHPLRRFWPTLCHCCLLPGAFPSPARSTRLKSHGKWRSGGAVSLPRSALLRQNVCVVEESRSSWTRELLSRSVDGCSTDW